MQRKKVLQIGVSDFRHVIDENGYFVDKTLFIKDIIETGYHVMIIPRPRRFGKSLNLSMLKYYFDYREKDTQALFEPFKIWEQGERFTSEQGKRPVIHFSLKSGKATSFEKSKENIYDVISNIYHEFSWLLETETLTESEVKLFKQIIEGKANSAQVESAVKKLSEYLFRHSGKKALILLDEYDTAIHAGFYHGFFDEIINLMKSILGATFKDNTALYKGVITGILRVAKESIFSDMNNPGIFTILTSFFSDRFGFTGGEVRELLEYFTISDDYLLVKKWYNGYKFGNTNNIYNPWSIINYITRREDGFKSYWGNTSSDDIIRSSIIAKDAESIRETVEKLINGETVVKFINENISFSDFEENPEVFWSLLTFSGYLTPNQDKGFGAYDLRIPNYEIQLLFRKIIIDWLQKGLRIQQTTLYQMTQALTQKRIEEYERCFKKIMGDTFSYFDIHTEPERVFQAYLLGLLGMLADDFTIKSNRESGKGRYDILLLPKTKNQYGILLELKQIPKDATENQIEKSLTEALQQIKQNDYAKELETLEIGERLEMAIVFVGKEVFFKHEFA